MNHELFRRLGTFEHWVPTYEAWVLLNAGHLRILRHLWISDTYEASVFPNYGVNKLGHIQIFDTYDIQSTDTL